VKPNPISNNWNAIPISIHFNIFIEGFLKRIWAFLKMIWATHSSVIF
jgi:hypothetical protein